MANRAALGVIGWIMGAVTALTIGIGTLVVSANIPPATAADIATTAAH